MNKIQEMSFIPRDLETVMVGRHSTTCYPKVEAKMPVHERASLIKSPKVPSSLSQSTAGSLLKRLPRNSIATPPPTA